MRRNPNRIQERTVKTAGFLCGSTIFFFIFIVNYYLDNRKTLLLAAVFFGCYLILSRNWMISNKKGIPILMFHSVTDDPSWLPWPYICVSVRDFISFEERADHHFCGGS